MIHKSKVQVTLPGIEFRSYADRNFQEQINHTLINITSSADTIRRIIDFS